MKTLLINFTISLSADIPEPENWDLMNGQERIDYATNQLKSINDPNILKIIEGRRFRVTSGYRNE